MKITSWFTSWFYHKKPWINWYYTPNKNFQLDDLQIRAGEVYGGVDVPGPNGPTHMSHTLGMSWWPGFHRKKIGGLESMGIPSRNLVRVQKTTVMKKPIERAPWNWNCPIVPWQSLMRQPSNNNKADGEARPNHSCWTWREAVPCILTMAWIYDNKWANALVPPTPFQGWRKESTWPWRGF